MGEMWFAFKTTVMTVVMVFFMQIKVGEFTIEENAYQWVKSNYLVVYLNEVSGGAVVAIREAYQGVTNHMTTKVKKTFKDEFQPGSRSIIPGVKRSENYLSELKTQMKNMDLKKVKDQMENYRSQLEEIDRETSGRRPTSND